MLPGLAGRGAAQLVGIDESAAMRVLVRAVEALPPTAVVPGLEVRGGGGGGSEGGGPRGGVVRVCVMCPCPCVFTCVSAC